MRIGANVNRGSNAQCSFPTVGQCTISQSVSAIIGRSCFGTVSFILYCHFIGECLLNFIFFIVVETLNYANIISNID